MGIVNVTPDSFSDGGDLRSTPAAAIAHGRARGARGPTLRRRRRRVDPPGLGGGPAARRSCGACCRWSRRWRGEVPCADLGRHDARPRSRAAALAARRRDGQRRHGAARRPARWPRVVAEAGADLCLMHMLGEPRTMQDDPRYDDVVAEVGAFLAERVRQRRAAGIAARRGSASTPASASARRSSTTSRCCAGCRASRRCGGPSCSGRLAQGLPRRADRAGGLRESVPASRGGRPARLRAPARWVLRVHDVAATVDALAVARAPRGGERVIVSPLAVIELRGLAVHRPPRRARLRARAGRSASCSTCCSCRARRGPARRTGWPTPSTTARSRDAALELATVQPLRTCSSASRRPSATPC